MHICHHHITTHVTPAITMCLLLPSPAKEVHLEEEKSGAFNCAHRRPGLGGSAKIRRILSFFGFTSPKKLEMVRRRYLPKSLHASGTHTSWLGWAGVGMKSQQTTLNANDPPVLAELFSLVNSE